VANLLRDPHRSLVWAALPARQPDLAGAGAVRRLPRCRHARRGAGSADVLRPAFASSYFSVITPQAEARTLSSRREATSRNANSTSWGRLATLAFLVVYLLIGRRGSTSSYVEGRRTDRSGALIGRKSEGQRRCGTTRFADRSSQFEIDTGTRASSQCGPVSYLGNAYENSRSTRQRSCSVHESSLLETGSLILW